MTQASKHCVFVVPSLGKGGAQRATVAVANELAMSLPKVKVTLISLKNDAVKFDVHPDIIVKALNTSSFRRSLWSLTQELKMLKPSAVYSALWHVNLLVSLSHLILRLKCSGSFYHIASVHNNPSRIMATENRILSFLSYYIFSHLPRNVVAVSQGVQRHLINKCGLRESKVVYIPNIAITRDHESQMSVPVFLPPNFKDKEFVIWVGRFDFQKNPIKFVDAVALTRSKAVMVGDGPMKPNVLARIEKLELQDRIICLPFTKNIMPLMREAKALVMTSRFEGFGLVLVESLYAGTPVISNDCNYGPAEIIKDRKNGLLLRADASPLCFAKAINTFYDEDELYQSLRRHAKDSVSNYHYASLLNEYRRVLRL